MRRTGGGPLLQKGAVGFLRRGVGFLRSLWRSLRSSTPSRRPSPCLPNLVFLGFRFLGCTAGVANMRLRIRRGYWPSHPAEMCRGLLSPFLAHSFPFFGHFFRAHTNRGAQQRTLLRRVLGRVLETAFEKVLRRVLRRSVLQWVLLGRRVLRRVLRRGSQKRLSRRHLEGRSTPFREYDPIGVCPILSARRGPDPFLAFFWVLIAGKMWGTELHIH